MKNPRQPEKRGNADGSKKVWEHRQSTGSGKPRQYPMFPTPSGMGNLIGQVCRSNLPDLKSYRTGLSFKFTRFVDTRHNKTSYRNRVFLVCLLQR